MTQTFPSKVMAGVEVIPLRNESVSDVGKGKNSGASTTTISYDVLWLVFLIMGSFSFGINYFLLSND